ncbi:hypothetical protein ACHAWF_016631 [Thalassiosira exigua]
MVVLQLPIPAPSSAAGAADDGAAAPSAAVAPAPSTGSTPTPSPGRSVLSGGTFSTAGATFSTTPVTSNLASGAFFGASAAATRAAYNRADGSGAPAPVGSGPQQPPFPSASRRPASFLAASSQAQPSAGFSRSGATGVGAKYGGNAAQHLQPAQLHVHQRGGIAPQLPPAIPASNPPWIRKGSGAGEMPAAPGLGARLASSSGPGAPPPVAAGRLGLGPVTVGGGASAMVNAGAHSHRDAVRNAHMHAHTHIHTHAHRLGNVPSANLLGTVTVGGMAAANASAGVGAGAGRGDGAVPYGHRANSLGTMVAANGLAVANAGVNVGGDGRSFANRMRMGRPPPRPPLLPIPSGSTLSGRIPVYPPGEAASKEHPYSQQGARGMQPMQSAGQAGLGAGSVLNPGTIMDFEEYHHGHDGLVSGVDFGADAASFGSGITEVPLTSGLLTLSVHEALTFDGVELALHPDVFAKASGTKSSGGNGSEGKEEGKKSPANDRRLRPGDLVEIRVWTARPGTAAEAVRGGSTTKIKGIRTSRHSRHPSLATVSSSISNTSFLATPRSISTKGSMMTTQPPPLVNVVEGSPYGSSPCSMASGLYGESFIGSSSGELRGEHLLETPKDRAPGTAAPNVSSVIASAASSLFRKASVPSTDAIPSHVRTTEDDNSAPCHRKESSLGTVSTIEGLHSRDSSLVNNTNWINALHTSASREEMSQISPPTATSPMQPVSEGRPLPQPQPHPLTANLSHTQHSNNSSPSSQVPPPSSQILPMRRDTSLLAASTRPPPPPPPLPPPPQPQPSPDTPKLGDVGSEASSSHPPSPKNQLPTPASTPPIISTIKPDSASLEKISFVPALQKQPEERTDSTTSREEGNVSKNYAKRSSGSTFGVDNANEDKKAHIKVALATSNASDSRRRASTLDAPGGPNRSNSLIASNQVPTHRRYPSLATSPTHRRYPSLATSTSDVGFPSSAAPILPPSGKRTIVAASVAKSDDDETVKDIYEILQGTHFVRVSFIMPVSQGSLSSIKSGARTQVSLLRQVADLYNITAYDTVTVSRIPRSKAPFMQRSVAADFLTMTFKDQFLSRGELYNFQKTFQGAWVYEGKRLSFNGIRTNTKVIRNSDHVIRSGIISEDTKLTFRSRSARIIWLVQMCSEMWDFASPYEAVGNQSSQDASCKIYFDKFVEFVRRLFMKWKKLQLTHNLTVVFFSRTYVRHREGEKESTSPTKASQRGSSPMRVDSDGRMFEDRYKIVIENETKADWDSMIHRMKKGSLRLLA